MEEIKLTQEELDLINKLQQEYSNKVAEFGNLKLQKINAQQQWNKLIQEEEKLEKEVLEIQNREIAINKQIQDKYGSGTLNLATGLFLKDK
jgi:hypothetical protein